MDPNRHRGMKEIVIQRHGRFFPLHIASVMVPDGVLTRSEMGKFFWATMAWKTARERAGNQMEARDPFSRASRAAMRAAHIHDQTVAKSSASPGTLGTFRRFFNPRCAQPPKWSTTRGQELIIPYVTESTAASVSKGIWSGARQEHCFRV